MSGCQFEWRLDHSREVKQRIKMPEKIFKNHDLTTQMEIHLLRCYIFQVLLYGAESWTLNESSMKRVEAFKIWCYRRILRISWMDHVSHGEILRRIGKETVIWEQKTQAGIPRARYMKSAAQKGGCRISDNGCLQQKQDSFGPIDKVKIALLVTNIRHELSRVFLSNGRGFDLRAEIFPIRQIWV